jgi:ribosome-associated translation inhibitor RaiA
MESCCVFIGELTMQVPLKINFHNMARSEALEARVRERVARLEKAADGIIACRVTVEAPHKQPHRSTVGITIAVSMPGKELVVKRELRHHETRADAYQVVGVAFEALERQIEDYRRINRHEVKAHDGPAYARIVRLYPEQDYGFIETATQFDVYFHRTVVSNDAFDQLAVGSEVLYTLADSEGPMGPQASRVQLVRGAHPVR